MVELIHNTNSILKTKSENINLNDENYLIKELIKILVKTNAVGIAANQIGETKNLFLTKEKKEILVFANSKIIEYSTDKCLWEEGCLSYPNLFLYIKRPKSIKIKYQTILNEKIIEKETNFDGFLSRIIQHEYDHVNGIVFVDRLY